MVRLAPKRDGDSAVARGLGARAPPCQSGAHLRNVWQGPAATSLRAARSGLTENRVQKAVRQAWSGARQVDAEGAALAHATVDRHASAVRLGDVLDDRQPQA